jgi:hypothetical protein
MITQMRFSPEIDLDLFWRFEGVKSGEQRQPSRASQRTAARLLPEALSLARPVAFSQSFGVRITQKKRLELENGACFTGGLVGHLLDGSQEVVVMICTLGPGLENRASQYFSEGHPARGYLLDRLGILALGALAERARQEIEFSARGRGLQTSTPISPGHADWPLAEQRVLFDLLPSTETGVALTQSHLMNPNKSLSMVVGLGENMITYADASQCQYCPLQKTCTYCHLPGDEWYPVLSTIEEAAMKDV